MLLETRIDDRPFRIEQFTTFPARIDLNCAAADLIAELEGIYGGEGSRQEMLRAKQQAFARAKEA